MLSCMILIPVGFAILKTGVVETGCDLYFRTTCLGLGFGFVRAVTRVSFFVASGAGRIAVILAELVVELVAELFAGYFVVFLPAILLDRQTTSSSGLFSVVLLFLLSSSSQLHSVLSRVTRRLRTSMDRAAVDAVEEGMRT